jgi:hypothetical protein
MARPLGKRGHRKKAFLYGSVTMGHELYLESHLETMAARALDLDPRVRAFHAQPFCITLDGSAVYPTQGSAFASLQPAPLRDLAGATGSPLLYTPDFLVELASSLYVLVEVKEESELVWLGEEMEQKTQAAKAAGYRMIVVTDQHVGQPGLESNLATLRDATKALRTQGVSAELRQLAQAAAGHDDVFTWQQLARDFPAHVLQMGIAGGVLGCELRRGMVGRNTPLWPAYGDLSHLQLLHLDD